MYIYNPDKNKSFQQLILNPDVSFHTSFHDENLNVFFRNLIIPKNVKTLVSLYIEYEFLPYLYEKYPDVYLKTSSVIQESIKKQFNYENAHLYHNYDNAFYLILFDVSEEEILKSFTALYQDLKKRKTIYHHHESEFRIYCGVYFSQNLKIDPVAFYKSAKHQFLNTQLHNHSIISILNLTPM